MKIMLTMNLPYEPAFGGANKANRRIAEMLARRTHTIRAVVAADRGTVNPDAPTAGTSSQTRDSLRRPFTRSILNDVDVHAVDGSIVHLGSHLAHQLRVFHPDCIIVSSEDPVHLLLNEAVLYDAARVVYLAHTPNCLPFGPCSFFPSQRGSTQLKQLGSVIAVSQFCAEYIRRWSGIEPLQMYLPVYGDLPLPPYGRFDANYVTLVNPCQYKGIDIFIELARSFPEVRFAGVISWGTTTSDLERMRALPNIRVLDPNPDIDAILKQTRVLLVPSLYLENFPMIIIEAMARGIPIISSNVGGIPEAKLTTNYVIEVHAIETYTDTWDERRLWIPVVPQQDCAPWRRALSELVCDRAAYEHESAIGRQAAAGFISTLSLEPLERVLQAVSQRQSSSD
jgi:glycosyltransferase involved in cell wall biosynthesis